MGDGGLELPLKSSRKSHISPAGGAQNGALTDLSTIRQVIDHDLALLIARWPSLSDEVRASVMGIINGDAR
jgi:hypothetical protein